MDNLKKYNDYTLEMKIINSKIDEPQEFFTKKEIEALVHNDPFSFVVVLKYKAERQIDGYKLSIYKKKIDEFLYRVRDMERSFSPIILENKAKSLRDCLYDLDEFMLDLLKARKEKRELDKKIKRGVINKPKKETPGIFSYMTFTGKGHM